MWPGLGSTCGEGAASRVDGDARLLDGGRRRLAAGPLGGRLSAPSAVGRRSGRGDDPGLRRRSGAVPCLVRFERPGLGRGGAVVELVRSYVAGSSRSSPGYNATTSPTATTTSSKPSNPPSPPPTTSPPATKRPRHDLRTDQHPWDQPNRARTGDGGLFGPREVRNVSQDGPAPSLYDEVSQGDAALAGFRSRA